MCNNLVLTAFMKVLGSLLLFLTVNIFSRLVRWLKDLLLLCIHPLSLMAAFVTLDTYMHFPEEDFFTFNFRAASSIKRALMYSVVDSMIYGNWVFPVACTCLLPVWLMLWHVLQTKVQEQPEQKQDDEVENT